MEERHGHHSGVHIHGSTVMIGNSGDNVTMSMSAYDASGAHNHQDEGEIIRIYRKLDIRHKSDFMGVVFAYEDEYDGKQK